MSGQQIGSAVGMVIGGYFGGPWGAQIGAMIGGAIGGAIDPTKIYGPRLNDASAQTSRDGVPRPFGYGTFPCMGNVIWQGPLVEREHTDDGKGSGTETTTYTYHRSYAIRVCEGPVTGLLQIKRAGKVVWDANTDEKLASIYQMLNHPQSWGEMIVGRLRAANAKFQLGTTIYLGDETQMPDPTIEALEGVGNVSPFRGTCYIVVEDDDLTEMGGAIPPFEFVVAACGTSEPMLGFGSGWNAEDMGHNGHLLNYGQTFTTLDSGDVCDAGVRSVSSFSEGKVYWELKIDALRQYDAGFGGASVGWADGSSSVECLDMAGQSDMSWGWLSNGSLVRNVTVGTLPFGRVGPTWGEGDTLMIAVNLYENKAWLGVNGVWFNDGDPSLGTNHTLHYDETYSDNVPLYAVAKAQHFESGDKTQITLRDSADMMWYPIPSGYQVLTAPVGIEIPDAPGYYVDENGELSSTETAQGITPCTPELSEIVADLCERRGLTSDEYDVSELTDLVPGFRVASETDVVSVLGPLAQAYQFDVGEWDGKLRFVKRGGTAVMSLNVDDLVERDGDAIEQERTQEAELLRKVTVQYLDPGASYNATSQSWERRTSVIEAKGEQSFEVPVVMEKDTAATVAKRKGLAGWAETERFKFSLPYKLTALTPTDVILLTDKDNTTHRVRLGGNEEDSGVIYIEGTRDGGEIYGLTATGVEPPPKTYHPPDIIGPTVLHVMDLPVWDRDANDELGLYVAAKGLLPGWQGASVQLSTDSGATWITAANIITPANAGSTTTALPAWDSAEYRSVQEVTVSLPTAPASVTWEAILNSRNRAALQNDSGAWEILQYQTVTDNGDGTYTLSGLVRGRYATTPGLASAGAAFVVLNEAVQFLRAERAYLDQALTVRGVSFGTLPENNTSQALTIAGVSQTEWPPHMVEATRDSGTDDVTVTWVERRRLGSEIAPFHSKYHSGFRVTYSDGQSYDVAAGVFTHTRSAAPASQTITVQALNSITGPGQSSEAVTV